MSSFAQRSCFKCSPSLIRLSTNCSAAPRSAFSSPAQSSFSSVSTCSIVKTSGYLDKVLTLISLSNPNLSAIAVRCFKYSPANSSLYFKQKLSSEKSSNVIYRSTLPRSIYSFSRLRIVLSKKFNAFGILIFTSR